MCDMCDALSSFLFPPPPFHLNSPATHTRRQGRGPSSLLRDVGPNQIVKADPEDLVVEEHEGGPKKWEARSVRRKSGLRHLSWPVSLSSRPTTDDED